MATCRKPWRSDPNRTCEAKAIPGLTACLAHVDLTARSEFLAMVHEDPAAMTGLLRDLEVHGELLAELEILLTRYTPIDFSGRNSLSPFC